MLPQAGLDLLYAHHCDHSKAVGVAFSPVGENQRMASLSWEEQFMTLSHMIDGTISRVGGAVLAGFLVVGLVGCEQAAEEETMPAAEVEEAATAPATEVEEAPAEVTEAEDAGGEEAADGGGEEAADDGGEEAAADDGGEEADDDGGEEADDDGGDES